MGRKNANARKRKIAEPIEQLIAPPDAQLTNGSYRTEFIVDEATGRQTQTYVNSNHDPVARWINAGRIDARQKAIIDTVRRLWDILGIKQRLIATYGERLPASVSTEWANVMYLDAKDDLRRIEGYMNGLSHYWQVFENVCRWGQSAGVAGCELGYGSRGSEIRAHQIVVFVCDIIGSRERI